MALEMNPEVRAQWCAALRSGDYKQTTEALRRLPGETEGGQPEGYCCLGVLTDLWIKAGHSEMIDDPDSADPSGTPQISVWANVEGVLSPPVMEWAGIATEDPDLIPEIDHGNAVFLNDGGRTFAQIADLIDGGTS